MAAVDAAASPSQELDVAVALATQAVHQDSAANYEEAARCYGEAVALFRRAARSNQLGDDVRRAVGDKCAAYEQRLNKLNRHLLSKADLSGLFRDCVSHELAREEASNDLNGSLSRNSVDSLECASPSSVDSEVLAENPYLRKGVDVVERAKRRDAKCQLIEALELYEQGAAHLLDAVRRGRVASEQQADAVRIKCLLIHDRCTHIRDHLESGAPLKIRREPLDSLEVSLEDSPESAGSPTPAAFEEEQGLLNMDEIKSRAASNVGSTHSLYPTCVEIRRTDSVVSDGSELIADVKSNHNVIAEVIVEEDRRQQRTPTSATTDIPLAHIDSELSLSALSFSKRGSSRGSSLHCSMDNLVFDDGYVAPERSTSLHSLYRLGGSCGSCHSGICGRHGAKNRSESGLDYIGSGKRSSSGRSSSGLSGFGEQADQNVTEMTFANSPFKDVEVGGGGSKRRVNSGSDSGFSDRSPEASARTVTPDIDVVSPPPLMKPSPSSSSSASPSATSTTARRRRSNRSTGSSVKTDDRVTILDTETVQLSPSAAADQKLRPASPEVYAYARATPESRARERQAYVPPRALAPIDEEEDFNKGCYYFMACLDSFWIL